MAASEAEPPVAAGEAETAGLQRSAAEWAKTVAHHGWLAKGFIFIVIGLMALRLARQGYSDDQADQSGALRLLADGPLGRVLLLVTSVGLLLFAAWQVGQAVVADETDPLGLAKRIGWLGLGATYGFLSVTGFQIALATSPGAANASGSDGGSDEGPTSPEGLTLWLFGVPAGRFVVALIGLGTIGVAAYHLQKGLRRDFLDDIDLDGLSDRARTGLAVTGTAGFAARGLVLGLVGSLFVVAAWQYDSEEAAGLDQALRTIAEAPWGRAILALCALGLIAAGLYDMATWRRQRLD